MFTNPMYLIYVYKENFALNNLQWLIWQNQTKPTNNSLTNHMHNYLTLCKQMANIKLNC